jgi:cytochrome c oxidase subunit 2
LSYAERIRSGGAVWFRKSAPFLLASLAAARPALAGKFSPVRDVSLNGFRPDALFWYVTWACVIAFALVMAALIGFSFKYRARAGHKAYYYHGTDRKSFAVTGILAAAVFFFIDMNLVRVSQADMKDAYFAFPKGPETVKVEIMPQQWAWNMRYAGPDGVFNTADDVVTLNDMRVPVNRPVMINLKSKDVIHSFYLPNFRMKQDANPGTVNRTWFQAKETGKFEIACSQMCGWAHYKMRGELTVLSEKDYEAWLKEAEGDAARRFDPADKEAMWGWPWID